MFRDDEEGLFVFFLFPYVGKSKYIGICLCGMLLPCDYALANFSIMDRFQYFIRHWCVQFAMGCVTVLYFGSSMLCCLLLTAWWVCILCVDTYCMWHLLRFPTASSLFFFAAAHLHGLTQQCGAFSMVINCVCVCVNLCSRLFTARWILSVVHVRRISRSQCRSHCTRRAYGRHGDVSWPCRCWLGPLWPHCHVGGCRGAEERCEWYLSACYLLLFFICYFVFARQWVRRITWFCVRYLLYYFEYSRNSRRKSSYENHHNRRVSLDVEK